MAPDKDNHARGELLALFVELEEESYELKGNTCAVYALALEAFINVEGKRIRRIQVSVDPDNPNAVEALWNAHGRADDLGLISGLGEAGESSLEIYEPTIDPEDQAA